MPQVELKNLAFFQQQQAEYSRVRAQINWSPLDRFAVRLAYTLVAVSVLFSIGALR